MRSRGPIILYFETVLLVFSEIESLKHWTQRVSPEYLRV
jgi:hypothetical protein